MRKANGIDCSRMLMEGSDKRPVTKFQMDAWRFRIPSAIHFPFGEKTTL
jgi:hypothetical protein